MRKFFFRIVKFVIFLILLIALLLVGAIIFLVPDLKTELEKQLTIAIGSDVQIKKAYVGFFPDLELVAKDVVIHSKDANGNDKEFVKAKSLGVSMSVSDLIEKKINGLPSSFEVESLTVNGSGAKYFAESIASENFSVFIDKTNGHKISGDIEIQGFAFDDGFTAITKTDATISGLNCAIDSKGGAVVTLKLDGTSFSLKNPNIIIESAKEVRSTLNIDIPSTGGYSVKGPVQAIGSEMKVSDRHLSKVTGLVDILVSGPLKTFKSQKIETEILGNHVQIAENFVMKDSQYQLSDTTIKIGHAEIVPKFIITRGKRKTLSASINAVRVPHDLTMSLIDPKMKDPPKGSINKFEFRAHANMDKLLDSLNGEGYIDVSQHEFKREKLTAAILNALEAIPFIGASLDADEKSVKIQQRILKSKLVVADQKVTLQNFFLDTPSYDLKGTGSIYFNEKISGRAQVIFFKETFTSLGFGFDKLGAILGKAGQIVIPLNIEGTTADPHITPDLVQLAKDNSGVTFLTSVGRTVTDAVIAPFSWFGGSSKTTPVGK